MSGKYIKVPVPKICEQSTYVRVLREQSKDILKRKRAEQ
jgi:hypothetical protein